MKISFLFTSLLISTLAQANESQVVNELCRATMPGFLSSTPLSSPPQHFFRPLPQSDKILIAEGTGDFTANTIFDLKTRKSTVVPGDLDGVPSPDEVYFTIPYSNDFAGISFYPMKGISNKSVPILIDPKLYGAYQALGKLGESKYRVLISPTEAGMPEAGPGLYVQDYDLSKSLDNEFARVKEYALSILSDPNQFGTINRGQEDLEVRADLLKTIVKKASSPSQLRKAAAQFPEVTTLLGYGQALISRRFQNSPLKICTNLGETTILKLPMLSKDGKRLGALDVEKGHSKIYDIDGNTGHCTEVANLGFSTGKIDFSFDNRFVTFHTYGLHETGEFIFDVNTAQIGNAYVYEIATGKIIRLTHFTSQNALFPAFNARGEILVRESSKSAVAISKFNHSLETRFISAGLFRSNTPQSKKDLHASVAIGRILSRLCLREGNPSNAFHDAMMKLSTGKKQCESLIARWPSEKDAIAASFSKSKMIDQKLLSSLTMEDLKAACPTVDPKGPQSEIKPLPVEDRSEELNYITNLVYNKCMSCHSSNSAISLPLDDRAALMNSLKLPSKTNPKKALGAEMMDRVKNGEMPPFPLQPLDAEERLSLLKYLNKLIKN